MKRIEQKQCIHAITQIDQNQNEVVRINDSQTLDTQPVAKMEEIRQV